MSHLSLKEYREMVSSIIDFKDEYGEMPEFTEINGKKIYQEEYNAMIEAANKFFLEMGRQPCSIERMR